MRSMALNDIIYLAASSKSTRSNIFEGFGLNTEPDGTISLGGGVTRNVKPEVFVTRNTISGEIKVQ